jgi:hypothetical protein
VVTHKTGHEKLENLGCTHGVRRYADRWCGNSFCGSPPTTRWGGATDDFAALNTRAGTTSERTRGVLRRLGLGLAETQRADAP